MDFVLFIGGCVFDRVGCDVFVGLKGGEYFWVVGYDFVVVDYFVVVGVNLMYELVYGVVEGFCW